jgi:uncharacterized delta-60 repeat protein
MNLSRFEAEHEEADSNPVAEHAVLVLILSVYCANSSPMSPFPCRILLALVAVCWFGATGDARAEPAAATSLTGTVTSVASQSDGKLVIAGPFSFIGTTPRAGIARLKSDGSLDSTFDPGPGANGAINLLALQEDGKVVMAGDFTAVAGIIRNRIARLNPDGTLDPSFNPGTGPNDGINALLIDSGAKIVLGGRFENFNGVTRHFLARLNRDGSLDTTFDAGRYFSGILPQGVTDIAFYPDGRLIAAGFFEAQGKFDLVRVAADGTVDQSFPSGLSVQGIAVQPDGKLYVSGYFSGNLDALRRYFPDGTTDKTFRPSPVRLGEMLQLQPDGKLLAVANSAPLVRFNYDGTVDSSFGPVQTGSSGNTGTSYRALALRPDGRIILAGTFDTVNGFPRSGVVRLLQNGVVDPSFSPEAGIVTVSSLGLNLSTRVAVGTGDNALIAGFIIDGGTAKRIMIRAIGPSLAGGNASILKPLSDPVVELRDGRGTLIARNDNWRTTEIGGAINDDQVADIEGSTIAPTNDAESAFIATLDPGPYTATVRGATGGTGIALVEMYDLDASSPARLANISTRGRVGIHDDVMIGGIILGGTELSDVLLRAIGPSLSISGVSGELADPFMELHDSNGALIVINDDWKDIQRAEIEATGLAPSNDNEAAILTALRPGNYTAVVKGVDDTIGVAVVEAFALRK